MKWYKGLVAAAVLTFLAVGCGGEQQAQESGSSNGGTILQAQLPAEDEEIAVITTSMKKPQRQSKTSKHWQRTAIMTV